MSARQSPVELALEPGIPVRVLNEDDWCADRVGWIVEVDDTCALVAFETGVAPRWYHAADLEDERVRQTECVIGAGRELLATIEAIGRGQVTREATARVLATLREAVKGLDQLETEALAWAARGSA